MPAPPPDRHRRSRSAAANAAHPQVQRTPARSAARGGGDARRGSRDPGDPSRSRAHHDDSIGEEDRLLDAVRDEQHRRSGVAPDVQQLQVEPVSSELVERPEGLVHEQRRRLVDQGSGQGHPLAACRPTSGWGSGPRNRQARRRPAAGERALRCRVRVWAPRSQDVIRQQHVAQGLEPGEEHRALEDEAELDILASLLRRLAVDAHQAGRGLEQA